MALFNYRRGARRGNVEFESAIKRGLPCIVRATIHPPEPDVGIFYSYAEITDILWPSGRPMPDALFDYAQAHDLERLEQEALEAAND